MQLLQELGDIETYQDVFWLNWLTEKDSIERSICAMCAAKYYRGDPQDVVHDVMLIAYERWKEYRSELSAFKTWVLWLTRMRLTEIYRARLPVLGARQNAVDGEYIGAINASTLLPLDMVDETVSTGPQSVELTVIGRIDHEVFWEYVDGADGMKATVLRAMADLAESGGRLSTRSIAAIAGVSHTTVARVLLEVRDDLEELL